MSETMASSGVDYFFGATTRYNVRRHIGKLECKMQIKRQRTCENRQMNKNIKETISTTLLSPTPVLQSSIHLYPALEIWTPCASRCWPGCALSWCTHNVDKYICDFYVFGNNLWEQVLHHYHWLFDRMFYNCSPAVKCGNKSGCRIDLHFMVFAAVSIWCQMQPVLLLWYLWNLPCWQGQCTTMLAVCPPQLQQVLSLTSYWQENLSSSYLLLYPLAESYQVSWLLGEWFSTL